MFDFLKKKIGGFIDGLTKKEGEKEPEKPPEEKGMETAPEPEMEAAAGTEPLAPIGKEPVPEPVEKEPPKKEEKKARGKPPGEKRQVPKSEASKTPRERFEPSGKDAVKGEEKAPPKTPEKAPEEEPAFIKEIAKEEAEPAQGNILREPPEDERPKTAEPEKAAEAEKPRERIKLGIVGTVKSIITQEVEISQKDVGEMLDSLELELLEADVDLSVAEGIKQELAGKLIGAKVRKGELHSFVSGSIKETLIGVMASDKSFDIAERAESAEKPLKIAFLGINGAGKTTTIAKVAKLLMDRKKKVVFAAADTFRAAAIEQMGVHAERLGVRVIKRDYGSDPASVAYDAVNFAKAHGIDAVLIDTAGRQDTNVSLMNEMKKLDRVIKPDIKIYVGESIAGNAIIEQVSAFNREIGIDAIILTKLDCDPKGGTMLSISRMTGIPIIYVGVGQGYEALERFDPRIIVERIVE